MEYDYYDEAEKEISYSTPLEGTFIESLNDRPRNANGVTSSQHTHESPRLLKNTENLSAKEVKEEIREKLLHLLFCFPH